MRLSLIVSQRVRQTNKQPDGEPTSQPASQTGRASHFGDGCRWRQWLRPDKLKMEINSLFAFLVESYLNVEIKLKLKRNEMKKKTAVSRDKIQSTGVYSQQETPCSQ